MNTVADRQKLGFKPERRRRIAPLIAKARRQRALGTVKNAPRRDTQSADLGLSHIGLKIRYDHFCPRRDGIKIGYNTLTTMTMNELRN